jgi:Ca-activated chloride channel homolog
MEGSFSQFRFADPWLLVFLMLLPFLIFYRRWDQGRFKGGLRFPPVQLAKQLKPSWALRLYPVLFYMRLLSITLLVLAFARPQLGSAEEDISTEGIDIMIAIDTSGSMASEDFRPNNRIILAKQVVRNFVQGRQSDRIGLVIFASRSFTKCPLTIDYDVLFKQIEDVNLGTIEDGTAIGNGLANAVNRLRVSRAKSRVIILLTDGVNNTGEIDPLTAADIARSLGVKVYTIGVGRQGIAPMPVDDPIYGKRYINVEVQIDEALLQKIAELTGGRYFRAVDSNSLASIFKTIDGLEKTKMSVKSYTRYLEMFPFFLWPGLGLLLGESLLVNTRFRLIP